MVLRETHDRYGRQKKMLISPTFISISLGMKMIHVYGKLEVSSSTLISLITV